MNLAECAEAQPVLLVGLSLGGFVAIEYAALYPSKVAGMVLSGCGENTISRLMRFVTRINRMMFRLIGTSRLKRLEEKAIRKGYPPAIAEPLIAGGLSHEVIGQAYDASLDTDYRAKLAQFPRPVLILNGEKDRFTRVDEGSLQAAARHGSLEIVSGAAHLCNLDKPEGYNAAIRRFCGNL